MVLSFPINISARQMPKFEMHCNGSSMIFECPKVELGRFIANFAPAGGEITVYECVDGVFVHYLSLKVVLPLSALPPPDPTTTE